MEQCLVHGTRSMNEIYYQKDQWRHNIVTQREENSPKKQAVSSMKATCLMRRATKIQCAPSTPTLLFSLDLALQNTCSKLFLRRDTLAVL